MRLIKNALQVARLEAALFRNFPALRVSVIGILFIPALYAFIYLSSVWDPSSRTKELPAAIVNLDRGTTISGQEIHVGADLAKGLKDKRSFGFYETADAEAARRDVREGRSLFALIIPADFSAKAMAANVAGAGSLTVYASEGNNYTGAGFAKRFAAELGHQVNETLNEKRWTVVLGATASSSDTLQRLRKGVAELRVGAVTLDAGMGRVADGSRQMGAGAGQLSTQVSALAEGVKQLGAGARTLDAKTPEPATLDALKSGAAQLAAGNADLKKAMPALQDGARKLGTGASQMRDQSKAIPFAGDKVSAAAGQLADGANQLQSALSTATDAQAKLAAGSQTLAGSVTQLADGFATYGAGVSMLASKFPADDKLEALSNGSKSLVGAATQLSTGLDQLKGGTARLALGLNTLAQSLPSEVPSLSGTPQGLADSVEPRLEIDAPVKNNGLGFAPNFIPVALWLGAVLTAFIFHLRRLPETASHHSRAALLLGKMGILGSINVLQALIVWLMVWLLLGLEPVHTAGLAITMIVSSLTFMLVILLLVRAFGDAGKAVALILLIVQLSAAGGVMPIELTNGFYRAVSPWLPFTWSVHGVRASAFGAFGNEWGAAVGTLLLFAGGAFLLAMFVGRWKFVAPAEHRPAMDI